VSGDDHLAAQQIGVIASSTGRERRTPLPLAGSTQATCEAFASATWSASRARVPQSITVSA
jgi:hypothetical protein